jgi:flagella basal body P-ring formation protein FlgA
MIRNTLALLLLVAAPHAAAAADAALAVPRLKELVTVTSELVRIGDLVDNAGAVAGVPVFRAPDLGQTGSVQVARVADALKPYDIAGLQTGGFAEVVVTRLSRAITSKDIEERVARALAGQHGFGDARNLAIVFDRDVRSMHVESSVAADLLVTRIYADPHTGRFDIAFELPGSAAARRLPLRFSGTAAETLETATLTRPIARGEIIKASDVVLERKPKAEAQGERIAAEDAVGLSARRALRAGAVLRTADLMKPEVVQRSETVTIMYELPGIKLTVRGKALEAGAVGDMINVTNTQSNRTVQATVLGPGRVTIAATMPRVAASVAPASQPVRRRAE